MFWSQRCKSNSPGFNGFGKYSLCFKQSKSSWWQCLPWRKKVSEVSSSVQSENCTHKIIIKFIIPYKLYTESFTYHTTQFVIHTCLELQKASFTSSAELNFFLQIFCQIGPVFRHFFFFFECASNEKNTWKISSSQPLNDANYVNTMWKAWYYHVAHVKWKKTNGL